ncbi:MAG: hypothetical protein Tsb005_20150 [Gammaproteobacteria bacterium]
MEYIELADNSKQASSQVLIMMWKFITRDISEAFEQWVYSCVELRRTLNEDSYYILASANYHHKDVIFKLRKLCFNFVSKFQLDCLCLTFPSNMVLYPFWGNASQLKSHIESLNKLLTIENFSGSPPVFCSRWYHAAELCRCPKCDQYYLIFFEESEGSDYYAIKLEGQDADIILNNPMWPNTHWPQKLTSWKDFNSIKFINWHHLYNPLKIQSKSTKNLMANYEYYDSRYWFTA